MLEFSADTRRGALTRMADEALDVLVIGGGITGCGVALDAASRGFRVGLVERDDFASGTSGRSSRMVHGGIRYLRQYEWGLVAECQRERATLRRLAPHLILPTPMYATVPKVLGKASWRAGLGVYDLLAAGRNIHRSRAVSRRRMQRAVPGLANPSSGFVYYESRTDDARLTIEVARASYRAGAVVANHAEVVGLLGDGAVSGAAVVDRISGERLEVRARFTVNAGGVWADRIQALATDRPMELRPSKGIHLAFRPGAIATHVGFVTPSAAHDGRFVFVIPSDGRTYAGTTDTDYDGDVDDPTVTEADREYILRPLMKAFPSLTPDDVVASWAGLRPLLGSGTGSTADLSRKHAIDETPRGLVTVTGGKLSTYRAMAADVVDRVARRASVRTGCSTREIRLGLDRAPGRCGGASGVPVRRRLGRGRGPDPLRSGSGRADRRGPAGAEGGGGPGPGPGDGAHG